MSLPARVRPASLGFFVWHDVQEGVSGLPVPGSAKKKVLPRSTEKPAKDEFRSLGLECVLVEHLILSWPRRRERHRRREAEAEENE